jgi:hypothetical protein
MQEDVMEMLTPEVLTGLGSGGSVLLLSIFFIRSFIDYQKTVMRDILTEMKEDRRTFTEAVQKMDTRLMYIEKILEREK